MGILYYCVNTVAKILAYISRKILLADVMLIICCHACVPYVRDG